MKIRGFLLSILTTLLLTFVCLTAGFAQNTSPENVVRLIYFLPNNRAPQPDIDTKLDREIKDVQSLFGDLLEEHGFERKTFQFEADARGNAVVHRVNGRFAASYYYDSREAVLAELPRQFDLSKNIYLISVDIGILDPVGLGCFRGGPCGFGNWRAYGAGGFAVVPAYNDAPGAHFPPVAHELGHAFGLMHDYRSRFRDRDPMLVTFCAAEWLNANRYFNDFPPSSNAPTTIRMLPPLAAPSYAIRLRFEVNDSDGLHQAQLLGPGIGKYEGHRGEQVVDCKTLKGVSNTIEFVTIELTGGPATAATEVWLQVTDTRGNFTKRRFPVDIASLLPRPEVVSVPDANLEAAIRRGLRIAPGDAITQLDMLSLRRRLDASWSKIIDLTGLEHAINLTDLFLFGNQIRDLKPIAGLTRLKRLGLGRNQITDVTSLAGLTQLTELSLNDNQIRDITPLAGLTQLRTLRIENNQIRDITPLAGLTQLRTLHIENNQIRDTSALTNLVNLENFIVSGNPLTTISPMAQVDFLIASDKVTIVESDKFIVYSDTDSTLLDPADPATVKTLNFHKLLHSSNLTGFFNRGGTIELVARAGAEFGDVVISEIMWGLDASSPNNQWIELYNTTSNDITLDPGIWGANWAFQFRYSTVSEWKDVKTNGWKVIDRVSNIDWKVPGQGGNTLQNQPLISMYRDINYKTGSVPDGTLASSWKASTGRVNLLPPSYGTPGAKHLPPSPVVLRDASRRPPMYWMDTETDTLHRLIGAKVENLTRKSQNATSLAVDVEHSKLYWTEQTGDRTGKIRRANLDGTNVQLVKALTSVPVDIALDTADQKLYLINAWAKVQRMNVDGSNFQPNLITNLASPDHLVLDVTADKLYWTEQTGETTGRIQRANLNGSNIEGVKELTSVPKGLTIDALNGKLYLTNSWGKVQRLNVDGSNFQSDFITGLNTPEAIAVDMADGKLYWIEQDSIKCANLNGENIQNVVSGLGAPANLVITPAPVDARVQAAPTAVIVRPNKTHLHPNYPNPFNPETWIPYQLAEPAEVTLTIYNINGRVVCDIDLGYQRAGIYESKSRAAYWNGRNAQGEPVASGVYFYTLKAGDFSATRKMLIRK